jgi:hypothetical protein
MSKSGTQKFTVSQINKFLLFKLPSAYFTGIRIKEISENKSVLSVTHRWINQNPFRSMYFGVQAMAAEIATGVLVMKAIGQSEKRISMLVTSQKGNFYKKATGKVNFICEDGAKVNEVKQQAIETGEAQSLILKSKGVNEEGIIVSEFEFEWGIKVN